MVQQPTWGQILTLHGVNWDDKGAPLPSSSSHSALQLGYPSQLHFFSQRSPQVSCAPSLPPASTTPASASLWAAQSSSSCGTPLTLLWPDHESCLMQHLTGDPKRTP